MDETETTCLPTVEELMYVLDEIASDVIIIG